MPTFRIQHGSLQDRFLQSRAKVQLFGGGFANGKTSGECIKCIEVAKDYPGANILMARSTYPKLNDTLRKEFLKWCPTDWIKSFPKSANSSNTCTLKNGTTINFRYISQQGKLGNEATTSNLLSATYDAIFVDQLEDPEIVHKDFLDLLGRLRGMTPYEGTDSSMPRTGPRWLVVTCNPTRNWVYRKLVKPVHDLALGHVNDDLLCETDSDGKMLFEDRLPIPVIEIFEGSTYENKDNLEPDFIKTLESAYKGQMRSRFLMGEWASYEGLVYPTFNEAVHIMSHVSIEQYYKRLKIASKDLTVLEGYDYGLAVPYCYIFGFCDHLGNVFLMDGGYEKEQPLGVHTDKITEIRYEYDADHSNMILSDPDIFRRGKSTSKLVGKAISDMFLEEGIMCIRGNNDITNGIVKVNQYLIPQRNHQNPITGEYNSPYLYVSNRLDWWINEISDYYWMKNPMGEQLDKPVDKNDHAMDTTKYILSNRPNISKLLIAAAPKDVGWRKWGERDIQETRKDMRHGIRQTT
jgi:phage terminase large subunit